MNITENDLYEYVVNTSTHKVRSIDVGQIISYDGTKNKATVQLCVKEQNAYGIEHEAPKLFNIPCMRIQGSNSQIRLPDSELTGEYCIVLYNKSDISKWKNAGNIQSQNSVRKFDPNDAVAIIGINPFTSITDREDSLVIEYKNSKIEIKTNGDIVINSSNNVYLGGEIGTELIARDDDSVKGTSVFLTWLGSIATYTGIALPPSISTTGIGTISASSTQVYSK